MLLQQNSRRVGTIAVSSGVLLIALYVWLSSPWDTLLASQRLPHHFRPGFNATSSNATLGFGVIYLLTEDSQTWRVQGLLKAANLSGLDVQVPIQRHLSDEDVQREVGEDLKGHYGPTRALLNHMAILDDFARLGHETALIIEDDVDFGINIRAQMDILSHALWNHSGGNPLSDEAGLNPYRKQDWDLLWLGHYGMAFTQGSEVFKYRDPYALPWSHLTSHFNNYYEQMASQSKAESPEAQQLIFNVAPQATFAYAITREHAARLVERITVEGVHRIAGTPFDTALHLDCVGLAHRCVVPVPQLFHHQQVIGEKAIGNQGDKGIQDMAWYHSKHKYTFNIEWSARCNAAHAGEKIGDRWQCLPNRYDEM